MIRLNNILGYHQVLAPTERRSGTSIVRWRRDGRRIAVKNWAQADPDKSKHTKTLRIHDVQTSRIVAAHDDISGSHLPMIDWSADDTYILDIDIHGRRRELGVTDPAMNNIYDDLIQNRDEFHHIAVSHEFGLLAVAGGNEVRICEPRTLKTRDSFELPNGSWSVRLAWSGRSFSPDRVTATRHNPTIRKFYLRLVANGKEKKVALVAAMRKFLTILNTLIKKDELWITSA